MAALLLPLAVLTTFFASAPWIRAFPSGTVGPLLLGAAVVSVLSPWLVTTFRPRVPAGWSMAVSFVLFFVYALVFVLHEPVGLADLGRGFVHGPTLLLSETLPIASPRYAMVVPVALCWLMGSASAELILRGRHVRIAAAIWPLGFVAASVASAGGAGQDAGWAALLVVAEGGLLCCYRWLADVGEADRDQELTERVRVALPMRSVVLGLVSLAVVASLTAVFVPGVSHLEGLPRVPARTPAITASPTLSPPEAMAELRIGQPGAPATTLFSVILSAPAPGYVSVADVDVYQGSEWALPQVFTPTGGAVAQPLGGTSADAGALVQQNYVIESNLPFPWMPYLDRPVAVSGLSAKTDRNSGMIVPGGDLAKGTAYAVVSRTPQVTLHSLTRAELARPLATAFPADVALPSGTSSDLQQLLNVLHVATGKAPAPTLSFLAAMDEYFRTHDHQVEVQESKASVGVGQPEPTKDIATSYADVVNAVISVGLATPEQFATLYALLARRLGVPARVVSGFRLTKGGGLAQPGRAYNVTNRDAWTWVEIPVDGIGWVVVDPTPSRLGAAPNTVSSGPSVSTTTLPQTSAQPSVGRSGHNLAPTVKLKVPGPPAGFPWLYLLPALLVVAAAVLACLPVLRRHFRRRRRHARGAPRQRVLGAWEETLDNLVELGELELEPLTASEVVALTRVKLGSAAADRVDTVATLADLALFDPEAPMDDVDAARAWRGHDAARRAMVAHLDPGARLRAAVRVAPGPTASSR